MSFDIEKFSHEKERQIRNEISNEWEKLDYFLFKNKDKKFKVVKIKIRKIQTKIGLVVFKRRIYKYYNSNLKKWLYISLLDEHLKIKKCKRFYYDVYNHIINFLGDGKRYRDIKDTIPKTNISLMTISRYFQNYNFQQEQINKIKVTNHETIYINLDDCFMNFNKLNKAAYKFRVISFNTGIKPGKKPVLLNKRIAVVISKLGISDQEKYSYIDAIWEKLTQYYDFDNPNIVIGGDGATWIRNVAKWFGGNYVFDRWHALKLLWSEYKPNIGRRSLKLVKGKYLNYMQAKEFFINGSYDQLINFLKETKTTKTTLSIFKSNKDGITNQNKNWNIGVSAESDVFHFVKSLKGNGAKMYNIKTYSNMIKFRISKLNSQI